MKIAVWGLLLCASCTLDYGKESAPSADKIPLMVFENLRETGFKDGAVTYVLEATGSASYPTQKQVRLKNLRFEEYDSLHRKVSEGEVASAVLSTASNNATLGGRLKVRSADRGVTLVIDGDPTGGLTWDDDAKILRTLPNTPVLLTKDDGSTMQAHSLVLDLGSNRLDLGGGVEGNWTPEAPAHANSLASSAPPRVDSPR